jgi:hypothetical protein
MEDTPNNIWPANDRLMQIDSEEAAAKYVDDVMGTMTQEEVLELMQAFFGEPPEPPKTPEPPEPSEQKQD